MMQPDAVTRSSPRGIAAGVAAVSAALLITELALTRIFSVTMYYHFAFLAISIALFGLSASGVFVYVARRGLSRVDERVLLSRLALLHAVATLVALAFLVRIRVGLTYSPGNQVRMLAIYILAALPFFSGGAVISAAFARLPSRINTLYGADLLGAAAGCLALIPLLNALGAPGGVMAAAALSLAAAIAFAPSRLRIRTALAGLALLAVPAGAQLGGAAPFDVADTKGHEGDRVLFSKWNSFSRVAVYDRRHADWSLSPRYTGPRGESLFMDIDSAASTPIVRNTGQVEEASYLRHELTAFAYHLVERKPEGFTALVIGPGGGRDLLSALVFGARHVDGVEINPIIADDVMRGRFREYSGGVYAHPRVAIDVADGRNFVRRSSTRYDVIQASLVDTWAATAAGAYTLTENSLYTTEAFLEYLDHLDDDGVLTITRWVFDGLRLISLAQDACARRGLDAERHLAIVSNGRLATFLLKKSPFSADDVRRVEELSRKLGFTLVYAPGSAGDDIEDATAGSRTETSVSDYRQFITADRPDQFIAGYPLDIRPTTDDRPFFFHTTRLGDQFQVAFGRSMLFGNGLSALLTLFAISAGLVLLFIVGPLALEARRPKAGWAGWLAYFGALGAGFMLLEVAVLQHFVLLLGHPVYSLAVTLFSLLLGTGIGSLAGRRVPDARVAAVTIRALGLIFVAALVAALVLPRFIDLAIAWPLPVRVIAAAGVLTPLGILLGTPMPGGIRLLARHDPDLVAWGWGMNGAFSVIGATLAVFIAMNWGFSVALVSGALVYAAATTVLRKRIAAVAGGLH